MISSRKACWFAFLLTLLTAVPSPVAAHGRPPSFNALRFDPNDPGRIVAQATWGAAVSNDAGQSWQWVCAAAFDVDARSEDPAIEIVAEGRVLLGTFDGLRLSDADGCTYEAPEPELIGPWVISLVRAPNEPQTIFAIETDVVTRDQLWRSIDEGLTWERWGSPVAVDNALLSSMAVAPSDPQRAYLGALISRTERRVLVYRSDDAGQTLTDLGFAPIEEGERLVLPQAVDPTDRDIVYAIVLHFNGDAAPERLVRSADGGETWSTVARLPQIADVVVSDDGQTVWTASKLGGVFRSDDRGLSFEEVYPAVPVRCLARNGDVLYGCFDQRIAGFAVGRSDNGGESWQRLARLNEIDRMLECPACTEVGEICPAWEPDVGFDLGFPTEEQPNIGPDGQVGLPRDPVVSAECLTGEGGSGRCNAATGHGRGTPMAIAIFALLVGGLARRRFNEL